MNDDRLSELREKFKDRNLLEELSWGAYHNHSGYTSKAAGEFLNWLCNAAYRAIKAQSQWIPVSKEKPRDGQKVLITYEYQYGTDVVEATFDENARNIL